MTIPDHPAHDIYEVVRYLDAIVDDCRARSSRVGYFAALYRRVTVEVKGRVDHGQFVDPERMNRLDTTFANRYFDAYRQHARGGTPTRSWAYAFAAADDAEPVVLQHLLLGMNAHISLDLGVASAEVARTHSTEGFRHDFNAINQVLSDLIDEIQDELGRTSGVMRRLDSIGGRLDELMCGFGLAQARRHAWRRSSALGRTPGERHASMIDRFDRHVERTSRVIHRPPGVSRDLLDRLRCTESVSVPEMIDRLA